MVKARTRSKPDRHVPVPRPPRLLRKWQYSGSRDLWTYQTESLEISVHWYVGYPKEARFVTVKPDLGLGMRELHKDLNPEEQREQALQIVIQYVRKLYDEVLN